MKISVTDRLNDLVKTYRSIEYSLSKLKVERRDIDKRIDEAEPRDDNNTLVEEMQTNELRQKKHEQRLNLLERLIAEEVLSNW